MRGEEGSEFQARHRGFLKFMGVLSFPAALLGQLPGCFNARTGGAAMRGSTAQNCSPGGICYRPRWPVTADGADAWKLKEAALGVAQHSRIEREKSRFFRGWSSRDPHSSS